MMLLNSDHISHDRRNDSGSLRNILVRLLAFVFLLGIVATATAQPAPPIAEYVPDEILLKFTPNTTDSQVKQFEQTHGLSIINVFDNIGVRHYRLPPGQAVSDAIKIFSVNPAIEFAEPNYLHQRNAIPSDPRFSEQWYLQNTGAVINGATSTAGVDINWVSAMVGYTGTKEVIVAVVDSGVAVDHPELRQRVWINSKEWNASLGYNGLDDDGNGYVDDALGWDFYNNDKIPLDENGHGTLVASLIAAQSGNGMGGVGVAPNARIMALKVGNELGSIPLATTIAAFTYAAQNGAKVINYSAGGTGYSASMLSAIQWLEKKGVLLVAAAGNNGTDNSIAPIYPASYAVNNIISVGAIDGDGKLATFSNFGSTSVHITAPGTHMFGAAIHRTHIYTENFETGGPGWTQGQMPGSASNLIWSSFLDALGNHWLTDSISVTGQDIPYQTNTNSYVKSLPISLTNTLGPQLEYRLWRALEYLYDWLYVEVSTDGGATWIVKDKLTGSSYGPCPGCNAAAGSIRKIDLSGYEGRTLTVRFRVVTDSAINNWGVFIDDVKLTTVDVFQYDGTQYTYTDGTSFSAPLVSGVAALLWSQRPDLTVKQIKQLILGSAKPNMLLAGKVSTGGQLDALAALQSASATPPSLVLSSEAIDFGKQAVGFSTGTQVVNITNTGSTPVTISTVLTSNPAIFTGTSNCLTTQILAPGASCTFNIKFSPTMVGMSDGYWKLDSDAPGSPHIVNLKGAGVPADTVPDVFSFVLQSNAPISTQVASNAITVSGINAASAISVIGGEYSVNGGAFVSAAGAVSSGQNVVVRLVTSAAFITTTSATLTIGSVSGVFSVITQAAPAVSLSPTSLTFTGQSTGVTSAAQTVTLTNPGTAALSIAGITASGDFAQTNNCGAGIAAGASCQLSITFTPTVAGAGAGAVTITSNAATSPSAISLSGTGTAVSAVTLNFVPGWNLAGNSVNTPLDVVTTLGDATKVTTVWKWVPATSKWAFYAPSMTTPNLAAYAAGKGYDILTMINGGEGFWVNAKTVFTAQLPAGTAISTNNFADQSLPPNNLPPGWSLIAIGDNVTPSAFNQALSVTPPAQGVIPSNITTLWAWDSGLSNWYFYAPSLEASGGLANYITTKSYLNFGVKTLDPMMGFWVNHP